jgi:hypothetical protein
MYADPHLLFSNEVMIVADERRCVCFAAVHRVDAWMVGCRLRDRIGIT